MAQRSQSKAKGWQQPVLLLLRLLMQLLTEQKLLVLVLLVRPLQTVKEKLKLQITRLNLIKVRKRLRLEDVFSFNNKKLWLLKVKTNPVHQLHLTMRT